MTAQGKKQRIQINLDLLPELDETLNNLAQHINGDNADLLLKAIAPLPESKYIALIGLIYYPRSRNLSYTNLIRQVGITVDQFLEHKLTQRKALTLPTSAIINADC
ncbi:hypothetical protein [Nostoc sp.]|uniref:hypothetical protein n=1 Tax=Nostoc sp. TaxID=1180 RepID=UPI002FFD1E5A